MPVKPDNDIVLSLRFFQFTIIISFELHQRSEDVLILVGILVSQQNLQVTYSATQVSNVGVKSSADFY